MPPFPVCSKKLPASAEKRRCAMLSLAWKAGKHLAIGLKGLPRRAAVALGSPGLGEPARPDRLWKATALLVPLALLTWWAIPPAILVMSPSIDALAVGSVRSGVGTEWLRRCRTRGVPLA